MEGQSARTVKTYATQINRIMRDVFNGKKFKVNYFMSKKGQDKIINYIDSDKVKINVKHVMYTAIIDLLKKEKVEQDFMNKYITQWRKIKYDIQKYNEEQINNPKEKKEDLITYDELKELKDKYEEKLTDTYHPKNDIVYVLLTLYSDENFPALRGQDYYNCKVVDTKEQIEGDENNYVVLDDRLFVRNIGKTTKNYGKRMIAMPEHMINTIRNFRDKSGSEWLLPAVRDVNKPFEQSHFTKFFQRLIQKEYGENKRISSSMMRKIQVSKKVKDVLEHDPEFYNIIDRLKNMGLDMGHSTEIQRQVYSRLRTLV